VVVKPTKVNKENKKNQENKQTNNQKQEQQINGAAIVRNSQMFKMLNSP